ncbi:acyl-CoA thioesterase [bacterium]|nr:acyl-CoA thioesterase [bacterium]
MKFYKEVKVYYHDTDAYGITWHGNYLKWYEEARCEMCEQLGLPLNIIAEKDGIVFPLVNVNLRYKTPAKLYDELIIETTVKEFSRAKLVFEQIIKEKESQTICNMAEITAVAVDMNGKLIRKLPLYVIEAFEKASS